MSKLWTDYRPDRTMVIDLHPAVPGSECFQPQGEPLAVNPLPRFGHMFDPLLGRLLSDHGADADTAGALNVLLHQLAQFDHNTSITAATPEEREIAHDMAEGRYGPRTARFFQSDTLLSDAERQMLVVGLTTAARCRDSLVLFAFFVSLFFPGARTYFYEQAERVLLYLPYEETEQHRERLSLLMDLFFDIQEQEPRLFWRYSFGVIGKDSTMKLGSIALY